MESLPSAAQLLRDQLSIPKEVLAVLLIIGGDIIQKACAQMASGPQQLFLLTPVSFSFGWVSYTFSGLMSAFGDGSLMPTPDISSKVVVLKGQTRDNESWVLARLIRDLGLMHERKRPEGTPQLGGLRVAFYKSNGDSNKPHRDRTWWTFWTFLFIQLGLAAAPLYDHRNWIILMVTSSGTLLAMWTSSLPQWRNEKYSGRYKKYKPKDKTRPGDGFKRKYILTRGNGHGHAFVIQVQDEHKFINFEDWATTRTIATRSTRAWLIVLAICWIVLLITVGGMEHDTWYLLLVGLVGMVQNVIAAGFTRKSDAHGIPLEADNTIIRRMQNIGGDYAAIYGKKNCPRFVPEDRSVDAPYIDGATVMPVLEAAEEILPGTGEALKPLFFPDGIKPRQEDWWRGTETRAIEIELRKREIAEQGDEIEDDEAEPSAWAEMKARLFSKIGALAGKVRGNPTQNVQGLDVEQGEGHEVEKHVGHAIAPVEADKSGVASPLPPAQPAVAPESADTQPLRP